MDTEAPSSDDVLATDRPHRRRRDERGASVVEYALLIALIAIVLFSAVSFLGDTTDASFSGSASSILEASG